MNYNYDEYYYACWSWPIISIGMGGLMETVVCYVLVQNIFLSTLAYKDVLLWLIFAVGIIYGLSQQLRMIYKGGIYLLHEKEIDAVRIRGHISEIKSLYEAEGYYLPRFLFSWGSGSGVQFTIDDIKCIAFTKGNLEVGDYVSVKYLPESRCILYIGKRDEEPSIDGDRSSV